MLDIDRDRIAIPLVVAVTGHRDLVPDEIPGIRSRVRELLLELQEKYPNRRLRVMSPLAEGADRLVAEEALAIAAELIVALPMPRELYVTDFESDASREEFDRLCNAAYEYLELPLARDNTADDIREHGHARNLQYAQMGVFLCAHCHILLALWDGKYRDELGGTGQVVRFHHDDIMPGYAERATGSQQMLVDDESDLVYHIVCSRDRPDGQPHNDFAPLDAWWFTKDENTPRTRTLPPQHELIFERGSQFSRDAVVFADQIGETCYPLYDPKKVDYLPDGIETIHYLFCIADWLAIHYQKRVLFALKATHILAFLMGLSFILYTELAPLPLIMFLFLGFFAATFGLQRWAVRSAWNRKYLDYRALAEGLRVQFYWAAAGVNDENESKFTHDNFLQTQDPELGWIRNVMRVAGTRVDAMPKTGKRALKFVLREWIGGPDSGQLGYYRKKSAERTARSRKTERWSNIGLAITIGIVLALLFAGDGLSENVADILLTIMGAVLLSVGIRQGYAYSTGEQELIKQYQFMLRIFNNARRRLNNAEGNKERRQILRALGGSCLDEHAEWILLHRDRSIEQSDVWRSGI